MMEIGQTEEIEKREMALAVDYMDDHNMDDKSSLTKYSGWLPKAAKA